MSSTHLLKKNKGFTLFASLFLILFLGTVIASTLINESMRLQEADARVRSQEAFLAAESGIDRAIFELRQNQSWGASGNPIVNEPLLLNVTDPNSALGFYSVRLSPAPIFQGWTSVWVRSDGQDSTQTAQRNIQARIILINPLNFLAFTLGDLSFTSGASFNEDVLGRDIEFRVDESLLATDPARDIFVDGTAFYMRSFSGYPQSDVTITGGPPQSSPSITFPGVDLSFFKAMAQGGGVVLDSGGSSNVSGTLSRANLSSGNGIVYVEGDLHISGTIADNMTFVASGDIYIEGDLMPSDPTDPNAPQIGIFAKKDVIIPASAPGVLNVNAFILADGGRFVAEKTSAKNTLNFTGAIAVRGDESGVEAIDLIAFSQRNYTHDPDFLNANIPFLPLGANVVTWEEVPSSAQFPPP